MKREMAKSRASTVPTEDELESMEEVGVEMIDAGNLKVASETPRCLSVALMVAALEADEK